jgi:hypothetical protein
MILATIILAADGPGGVIPRGPNWDTIAFANPIIKWVFGGLMALIVIYCAFKALIALKNIGGAESSGAASQGGQALAFSFVAIAGVYFFYDLFAALVTSAA